MLVISLKRILEVFVVLIIVAIAVVAYSDQSAAPQRDDAFSNLTHAYNLARHGSFSNGSGPSPAPGNYREPLGPALVAGWILLDPRIPSTSTLDELNKPPLIKYVVQSNIVFAILLLIGAVCVIRSTIRGPISREVASITAIVLISALCLKPITLTTLNTELLAAVLIVWLSVATLNLLRTCGIRWAVSVGVLVAALTLNKAAYLYVAIAYIIIVTAIVARIHNAFAALRLGVTTIAACAILITPWIARNYIAMESLKIAQRGGVVLNVRAHKNDMTWEEWRGAWYVYAPRYIQPALGTLLGYTKADLAAGGRLQKLNRWRSDFSKADSEAEAAGRPDLATSYYSRARAERVKLQQELKKAGVKEVVDVADSALTKDAVRKILRNPFRHIATTPIFLWRGLWSATHTPAGKALEFFIPATGFISLCCLFWIGLRQVNDAALSISLFPAGVLAFLSVASHFIPRYSEPLLPSLIVALVVCGSCLAGAMRNRM